MIAERELARVEGTRLARNPVVWIGLVPTVLWVRSVLTGDDPNEDRLLVLVGFGLLIPGFIMVTHTMLAVLRSRFSNTEELLGVVPVGPDRRSTAHGASTLAGLAISSIVTIAIYAALRPGPTMGRGFYSNDFEIPRPNLAQLMQGPLAVVAVMTFVIAVVRWVPTWLVMVPLGFMMLVQGVFLGVFFGIATGDQTWWLPLATGVVHGDWIGCGETDFVCDLPVSGFDRVTPWWHLAYLVTISPFFIVVAVLRHRRDRVTWSWFVATLAVVVALAITQVVVSVEHVPAVTP